MNWKFFPVLWIAFGLAVACSSSADDEQPDPNVEPPIDFPAEVICTGEPSLAAEIALPKNIVVLLGDGMGPLHVEAGRMFSGGLSWDTELDGPVYVNTDSLTTDRADDPDLNPTDSAASATAMATGVRVINGAVSEDEAGQPLQTVMELAHSEGKAVGLVTTSYLYDASPMAFAAHAADRDLYDTILDHLLTTSLPDVVMGGALDEFSANDGARTAMAEAAGYHVVTDETQLDDWDPSAQPMLLGLFESSRASLSEAIYQWGTTPFAARDQTSTDPRLATMATRALDRLSMDEDGFFLFIEDEHIDTLGHISLIERDFSIAAMPEQVVEFHHTFAEVIAWLTANDLLDDTLIVVTADHECGDYTLYGDNLDDAFFWSSTHTRTPVMLWARGPGSEHLDAICRVSDIHALLTGRLQPGSAARKLEIYDQP